MTVEWLLASFGQRKSEAVKQYKKYVLEGKGLPSPWCELRNQVYLGGDFSVLNILPYGELYSEALGKRPNFKAVVNFSWLLSDGTLSRAKHAQLILYPDYPEVRFSGFLKGCKNAPSESMRGRAEGRLLFIGVTLTMGGFWVL